MQLTTSEPSWVLPYSAVLVVLLSSACTGSIGTLQYLQNDEISDETRNEIHGLNQIVIDGLLKGDAPTIRELFLDEITQRPGFETNLTQTVRTVAPVLADNDIGVFHEFDITFSATGPQIWALVSNVDDGFIIHTSAVRNRMFVSLVNARTAAEDRLIGLQYVYDGTAWRLYDLRVQLFRVAGKSAIEWWHEAQELHAQGLSVPAQLRFAVATSIIRPLPSMQYVQESQILNTGEAIAQDMSKLPQLPLELSSVSSRPTVYAITLLFVEGQLTPLVQYISGLGSVPISVEKEKWRNLRVAKHTATTATRRVTPCRRLPRPTQGSSHSARTSTNC